jgi:hypothetical protein
MFIADESVANVTKRMKARYVTKRYSSVGSDEISQQISN